ncbi:MAG: sugar transferase, partial [Limisphaerales bacterium]
MLRRDRQLRRQSHQLLDATLFGLSFWLAYWVRGTMNLENYVGWIPMIGDSLQRILSAEIKPFASYLPLYFIIIPMAPLVLEAEGFYKRPILFSHRETFWILAKSASWTAIVMILAIFLFRSQEIARAVIILFALISVGLMFLKEELVRWGYKTKFGLSQLKKRLILIGAKEDTIRLSGEIKAGAQEEIEIVRALDLNEISIDQLIHFLHEHSINSVIINANHIYFGQVEKAIQACEVEGVEALLVADFFKTQVSRTSLDDFYGRPVLVFHSGPEACWQGVVKQIIDFTGALLLLILLSPLLLVVARWIKFSSPGPILFKQLRSGLNGQPFTMYKFRSMVTNAEQLKHE